MDGCQLWQINSTIIESRYFQESNFLLGSGSILLYRLLSTVEDLITQYPCNSLARVNFRILNNENGPAVKVVSFGRSIYSPSIQPTFQHQYICFIKGVFASSKGYEIGKIEYLNIYTTHLKVLNHASSRMTLFLKKRIGA